MWHTAATVLATSSSTSSPSTSTPTTSHTSTTSISTASSATPTTTAGWTYLGCYQDQNNRIMSNGPTTDNAQTIAKCLATCQSGSYKYAGVEYGEECWCSNTMNNPVAALAGDCNMPCAGQCMYSLLSAIPAVVTDWLVFSQSSLRSFMAHQCISISSWYYCSKYYDIRNKYEVY